MTAIQESGYLFWKRERLLSRKSIEWIEKQRSLKKIQGKAMWSIRALWVGMLACVVGLSFSDVLQAQERRRTDDRVLMGYEPKQEEGFLTKEDLAALGCQVESGRGTYVDVPLSGYKAFNLRGKNSCVVNIVSSFTELRYAKKDAAQLWKDEDDSTERLAKKCKCAPIVRDGTLGEKSRIAEFPGQGKERGFSYVIQDRGFFYKLWSRTDQPALSPELDKLLVAKLAMLEESASSEAGNTD